MCRGSATPRIVIVGAGIAGLTLAAACRRLQLDAIVLEKSPDVRGMGGGLVVYPNGVRILDLLNLGPWTRSQDAGVSGYFARGSDNDLLLEDSYDRFNSAMGKPIVPVLRSELLAALKSGSPSSWLRFGVDAADLREGDETASIVGADGEQFTGDLVVLADGIGSGLAKTVTRRCLGYTGIAFWGGVLTGADCVPLPPYAMQWWFGTGRTCCVWPIAGCRQWWYVMARIDSSEVHRGPEKLAQVRRLCSGWDREIEEFLACEQTPHNFAMPVWEVAQADAWRRGRVVMIGDAAHAIGPTTGQGANLAIEDAFALACCIAAHRNDIGHALQRYEAIRRPSVEYVREYERTTSAVRVSSDPAVIAARERMIRTGSVDELLSRIRPVSSPAAFHAVPEYAMLGLACQQGHA